MVSKRLNIWMLLPVLAFGLMSVRLFAPLSETWDKILGWAAIMTWLVFLGTYLWEDWRKRQADQSSSAAISSSD